MKEKVAVQQAFTKNRADYVTSTTHAQGPDLDIIIDWLQPTKQMRALDVATGGGHVAKRLAPSVEHVFATDLTKPMLENTAKFLQAEKKGKEEEVYRKYLANISLYYLIYIY